MSNYKIKKGVPIAKSGRSFGSLVDLSKMEVGDSFSFPPSDERMVKLFVNAYGKKNGAAFLVNLSETATCWRTA